VNKACLCTWCGNRECVISIVEDDGNHIGGDDVSENLPEISECFDYIDYRETVDEKGD
jgi:hypothetical protein